MVEWQLGQQVVHFLLYTSIDGTPLTWHRFRVVATLQQPRRDGFTHDAVLHGQRGKRGVALSEKAYLDGCWLAIEEVAGSSDLALAPEPVPSPSRAPGKRRRRN